MGRNELDRIYVSDVKLTKIYCGGVEVRTVFNPAKTLNVCPAMTVLAARSTLGVRFASGIGGSPVWTTLIGESDVVEREFVIEIWYFSVSPMRLMKPLVNLIGGLSGSFNGSSRPFILCTF